MAECRSKPSVAVIDSNPNDRKQLANAIGNYYSVTQFSEADAALVGLRKAPPALIIVDEMLVPCGGYDFIGMIRADRALATIPAMVISALDVKRVRDSIIRCGGNGYLPKPWMADAVLKNISKTLNKAVEKKWELLPEIQRVALKGTLENMNHVAEALETGGTINYADFRSKCTPLIKMVYDGNIKSVMEAVNEHDNYTFAHSFLAYPVNADTHYMLGAPNRRSRVQRRSAPQPRPRSPAMI